MLKISSQKRGNAEEILAMPFFKSANLITPTTQIDTTLNSPISMSTYEMEYT